MAFTFGKCDLIPHHVRYHYSAYEEALANMTKYI